MWDNNKYRCEYDNKHRIYNDDKISITNNNINYEQ